MRGFVDDLGTVRSVDLGWDVFVWLRLWVRVLLDSLQAPA